ncbi:hypothetical protein GGI17_003909 [Coemansia sp. S146]|nr:hypothetical protein GGI17_003909 [Coemansia sp. S146]
MEPVEPHTTNSGQVEQPASGQRGGIRVYYEDQLVYEFQSQEAITLLLDSYLPPLQAADNLLSIAAGTDTTLAILPPVTSSPSVSSIDTLITRAPSTASTRSEGTSWRNKESVSLQSYKRRALNPLEEADRPDISLPVVSRPKEYVAIYYYVEDRHDREEPGSSRAIRDNTGNEVTSALMSALLGPCPLMAMSTVSELYLQTTHSQLVPSRVDLLDFCRRLGRIEGFEFWTLQHSGTNFVFLQRQGLMLQPIRQSLHNRLRLFDGPNAVVLNPVLCYHLLTLGCIPLNQLSGFVLNAVFMRICGRDLNSLNVVTGNETRKMSNDEIYDMVKTWAQDLCLFISVGKRMPRSLAIATNCFARYEIACTANGNNGSLLDQDGEVAKDMLARNVCLSKLVLGLRPTDLKVFYGFLPYLMKGVLDDNIIERLRLAAANM